MSQSSNNPCGCAESLELRKEVKLLKMRLKVAAVFVREGRKDGNLDSIAEWILLKVLDPSVDAPGKSGGGN